MDTAHAELTTQEKELSGRQAKVEALQREVERLTVKIDHTLADLDREMQKRRLAEESGARQKVRIVTHTYTHTYVCIYTMSHFAFQEIHPTTSLTMWLNLPGRGRRIKSRGRGDEGSSVSHERSANPR